MPSTPAATNPQAVAHFLDRLLFCLFAEDTGLLPKGLLSRLADATRSKPDDFGAALGQLFATMAPGGGMFGVERIDWFNGGLFDSAEVLRLTAPEIGLLVEVGRLDWGRIEPAIFGTLFERGLDPAQRTQLGAHYTSRDDIWRLVEPVVIRPLRREYAAMQAQVTQLTLRRDASPKKGPDPEAAAALRGVPRSAPGGPRPRSRLWLGQLPVHRPAGAQGPRARGDRVGLARPADPPAVPAASAPRRSWASRSTPMPPSSPG